MKLFLTGGTGFFGKSILRRLIKYAQISPDAKPPEVSILSRRPEFFLSKHPEFKGISWIKFYSGNVNDFDTLPTLNGVTHVIHAAGDSTDVEGMTDLDKFDQIITGTRNILELSKRSHVQKFLFISSGAAYGSQPSNILAMPENYFGMPNPLASGSVYGVAKRGAENLCSIYGKLYNMHITIARCFAFVGGDLPLNAHFAIGNFIRDALGEGNLIRVSGNGYPMRSYLYQDDLADWLIKILNEGESGEAYNVGSDFSISIKELAELVCATLSPSKKLIISNTAPQNQGLNCYIPDITKAKNELGLKVTTSLVESIELTANAHKKFHG